ncbi:MAG: hypothetical protein HC872_00795 [Gammaproteobacteria bacterium]|nr:hypothetical protein [Gammaproteobacteria bacterium]
MLDLLGVIEQLNIPKPSDQVLERAKNERKAPSASGRMALITHWRRQDPVKPEGAFTLRMELYSPKGERLAAGTQDFNLRQHVFVRNIMNFNRFPYAGVGLYTAKISVKKARRWAKVGEASFMVQIQATEPQQKVRIPVH